MRFSGSIDGLLVFEDVDGAGEGLEAGVEPTTRFCETFEADSDTEFAKSFICFARKAAELDMVMIIEMIVLQIV